MFANAAVSKEKPAQQNKHKCISTFRVPSGPSRSGKANMQGENSPPAPLAGRFPQRRIQRVRTPADNRTVQQASGGLSPLVKI